MMSKRFVPAVMLFLLACVALFTLAGCGSPKQVKGAEAVRCNGVYQSTDGKSWLRFFEDGSAALMSGSDTTPEKAFAKMERGSGNNNVDFSARSTLAQGVSVTEEQNGASSTKKMPDITLEVPIGLSNVSSSKDYLATYQCFAVDSGLHVKAHSTLNGANWETDYRFIEVK